MMPEHLECPTIGGHSVVAADNPPQPFSLIRKRISHCWLIASKNDRMSASSMKLTFLLCIPTQSASSASCVPRNGLAADPDVAAVPAQVDCFTNSCLTLPHL